VARWLNQQHSDNYSDTYNDITGDEFGDTGTETEVSSVDGCDVAGVYDTAMKVAHEETVVSSNTTYPTDDVNLAGESAQRLRCHSPKCLTPRYA